MSDQIGETAIVGAVHWVQALLVGSAATSLAVIAVASVGFLLLAGRLDVRRAVQVVFGCFIIFGASSIAGGLMQAINGNDAYSQASTPDFPQRPPPPPTVATPPGSYDPYAGASVPAH
jgi:type IV secretory pathway VirB2 component (pilin)